ncbi:hypothetical protein H4219_006250, partial [Mycoemilia scoparia]
ATPENTPAAEQASYNNGAQRGGGQSSSLLIQSKLPPMPNFDPNNIIYFLAQFDDFTNHLQYSDEEKCKYVIKLVPETTAMVLVRTDEYECSSWLGLKLLLSKLFARDLTLYSDQEAIQTIKKKPFDKLNPLPLILELSLVLKKIGQLSTLQKIVHLKSILPTEWKNDIDIRLDEEVDFAVYVKSFEKRVLLLAKRQQAEILNQEVLPITNTPQLSAVANSDTESMIKQFENMVLRVVNAQQPTAPKTYSQVCIYCGSNNHLKNRCDDLTADLCEGKVKMINGKVHFPDDTPVPINRYNGYMIALTRSSIQNKGSHVVHNLTIEEPYEQVVEDIEFIYPEDLEELYDVNELNKKRKTNARTGVDVDSSPSYVDTGINTEPFKCPPPTHTYISQAERSVNTYEVMKRIMNETKVTMTLTELQGMSPAARVFFQKHNARHKTPIVPTVEELTRVEHPYDEEEILQSTDYESPIFAKKSVLVWGWVNGQNAEIVIDPGSEINVINAEWAKTVGIDITTAGKESYNFLDINNGK